MKEILKKDWMYILLLIVVAMGTAVQIYSFDKSLYSAHDEAYFLLKMQEAYDHSCIEGKSQWNLLAAKWFCNWDLSLKFDSCLASIILFWLANLYAAITACVLINKKKFLRYWVIISLIMFFQNQVMSYIPMQSFLLCCALCSFLIYTKSHKQIIKCTFSFLTGLSLGFSCFSIIPSALLTICCALFFIVLLGYKDWHNMMFHLFALFLGGISSLFYVHFFVCDIADIVKEMLFTATYFTKNGNRYDSSSILMGYLFFGRDLIFVIISYVGAFYIANKSKSKILGTVLYGLIIVIYSYYQQKFSMKLSVTNDMLLSSIVILPLLFDYNKNLKLMNFENIICCLFLLAYPMMATLGTNTGVADRLGLYVYSWLILYFYYDDKLETYVSRRIILPILFLYSFPILVQSCTQMRKTESYHFLEGSKKIERVSLTKNQFDYFNRVYSIMKAYQFEPGKSVMFTTAYDYATMYAIDAVNSTNFHNIANFKAFKVKGMIQPDFIILCKMDSITLEKELRDMDWNWPESYDCYAIGNPENPTVPAWYNIPDINNRNLYCRKKR